MNENLTVDTIKALEKINKKIEDINKEIEEEIDPTLKFIKEVRRRGLHDAWYAIQEKDLEDI